MQDLQVGHQLSELITFARQLERELNEVRQCFEISKVNTEAAVGSSALLADIQRVNQWACCGEPEARVRAEHAAKELHAELRRTKWALEYCLRTLKHHHMTKPGIAATVEETERRMSANDRISDPAHKTP